MIYKHSTSRVNQNVSTFAVEVEIDDEGIERDSEDIDDEKFSDTKDLDHVLEVSLSCFVDLVLGFRDRLKITSSSELDQRSHA